MRTIGTKHGHHSDACDRPMTEPPWMLRVSTMQVQRAHEGIDPASRQHAML